jgi:hypothetical protein
MYINGFGSRPMVDGYALLAFPLAAWARGAISGRYGIWPPALLGIGFVLLNLWQVWQVQQGLLWPERGNWAHYKEMLGQIRGSERALAAFESGEVQPPEPLRFVKKLSEATATEGGEGAEEIAGRWAWRGREEFNCTRSIVNDSARLLPGDWLRVSATAFLPKSPTAARSVDDLAKLVLDFSGGEGQLLKYRALNIGTHIGNPDFVLWKTGPSGEWGEASFFVRVPMGFSPGSRLKTYLWNPKQQEIYLHKLEISLWGQ